MVTVVEVNSNATMLNLLCMGNISPSTIPSYSVHDAADFSTNKTFSY